MARRKNGIPRLSADVEGSHQNHSPGSPTTVELTVYTPKLKRTRPDLLLLLLGPTAIKLLVYTPKPKGTRPPALLLLLLDQDQYTTVYQKSQESTPAKVTLAHHL